MNITSFTISSDKTSLLLYIEDAATVNELNLWTKETYKIDALKIDLSSKLTGEFSQFITITPVDLGITKFDGVYFIEAISGSESSTLIAHELSTYKQCILDKILAIKDCQSCLDFSNPSILNAQTLLYTLELAIEENMIQETLHIVFALDKLCGTNCKGCGKTK